MKTKVISILFMPILISMTFCTKNDQKDQEGDINSLFTIELISNPSTGYTWKWTNKQSITIVDSVGYSFTPTYSDRRGSNGIETWTFKGKKRGTEILEFKYNRSWDPESTIDQKSITLTVN